jgi:hypothetical protein
MSLYNVVRLVSSWNTPLMNLVTNGCLPIGTSAANVYVTTVEIAERAVFSALYCRPSSYNKVRNSMTVLTVGETGLTFRFPQN